MVELDARGLSCPEPVLIVKRAVDNGDKEISITVDNVVAVENIKRFCNHAGLNAESVENADGDFDIRICEKN